MSREELDRRMRELQLKADKAVSEARLKWLRQILNEAQDYDFKTLGELVGWIVDHSEELKPG
jgi:hypothetical protein